ncbi:MAG: hypothetical protein C9356_10250 [Oleiphilus sp.]|nr:MAG: hypothetical protein C9356_10250 [Oleiphilus sp.]
MIKTFTATCLTLASLFVVGQAHSQTFDAQRLDYTLAVGPWFTEYKTMSFFVLPSQEIDIHYDPDDDHETPPPIKTCSQAGCTDYPDGLWKFTAPNEPGLVSYRVQPKGKAEATLNIFVMYPAKDIKEGKLNGYRIGQYPDKPYKGLAIYNPPLGFVEVTKENENTFIAPHYQLKQFVSKQGGNYPRYVVLQTRMLRKLEFLTEEVNKKGIYCNGFHVMSGFRTPYYNKAINNKLWSRHQWGGAADIFVDENPKDGYMDDLNKDGKRDVNDAKVLASIVEKYFSDPDYKPFIGGMGIYKKNAAHGPFVHVDVRGFRARW